MEGCIAVLNAGSSSIKFGLYESDAAQSLLYRGQIEQIGVAPRLHIADSQGRSVAERNWPVNEMDAQAATREILKTAAELIRGAPVLGIGHRVAHGGMNYAAPILINEDVMAAVTKLIPLAPLHQPNNLAPIEAIIKAAPQIPQVACFDTAFHRGQPRLAQLFALPRRFTDAGVRRYGFHGLSYEYVASRFAELAPGLANRRVVIAHLGSGASLCALSGGHSIATTMGFTAVDGIVMGTRCGALDPGVIIFLMDQHGMDVREIEDLVYRKSGLLGVSGVSSDMRKLRASKDPAAREAIDLFVYRIVREIGSLAAALGGLDAIVFTGGIGENDVATRAEIAEGCLWSGLELDMVQNAAGKGRISAETSRVSAWVIPTDEELMIARHTSQVLKTRQKQPASAVL